MSDLINKIRKAREHVVEVGAYKFTVRRPTDVQMMELGRDGAITRLLPYVIGWNGVKEIDVIPGGGPLEIEFNSDLAAEWLSDRPDLLGPLIDKIMGSYKAHVAALAESAKN